MKRTIGLFSLRRLAMPDIAFFLEIDVPACRLAGAVLQCEGEDGVALLDGVFALGRVGCEGGLDGVEGGGGGERGCRMDHDVTLEPFKGKGGNCNGEGHKASGSEGC